MIEFITDQEGEDSRLLGISELISIKHGARRTCSTRWRDRLLWVRGGLPGTTKPLGIFRKPSEGALVRYLSAAVALIMGQPAWSTITETSPGHFECRSPPGRYERFDAAQLAAGTSLTATFRFIAGTPDRSYAPTAGLVFMSGDERDTELQVTHLRGQLLAEVRPPRATRSQGLARRSAHDPVEIFARRDAAGVLTIESSRRSVQVAAAADRTLSVQVTCQSGSFAIDVSSQQGAHE